MSIAAETATGFPGFVAVPQADRRRLYRFSVEQYHRLGELGLLEPDARVELLEGLIFEMSPIGPAHTYSVETIDDILSESCPEGWTVRSQQPVIVGGSELQPDVTVARGDRQEYRRRHPTASDIGLVVEVADSTLDTDEAKGVIYAQAGIARYWIVDLVHRQVQVLTEPALASSTSPARYARRDVFREGQLVPLILDERTLREIPVSDLLP